MDPFSYLSVLLSIILGLGLTQLLTAAGRLIRHRAHVRMHWLPALWAGVLLVIYVQVWWSMYGLRTRREWSFLAFGIVLAQTATLYVMAALALPEQIEEAEGGLIVYFERHRRWFFGFFLATLVISVVKDVILEGRLPFATNLLFHAILAASCVVGIVASRRRVQEVLGVGATVVLTVYIAMLFAQLH